MGRNERTKTLEQELCPFVDKCATEYGDADVCKDENYKECVIYRELIKYKEKRLR